MLTREKRPLLQACPAGPYSTYRLFEWCMATMMILIAFTLVLPGDTMERAALKPIAEMGFSEENMALFFGAIGGVRTMALYLNGHINNIVVGPKGAYIRAICATGGCFVMGQFTAALIFDAFRGPEAASFVIPVFGTLAGFEALSVYIAVLDGVSRRTRMGHALDRLEKVVG
ncbi:hypothetical protein [Methylobacterium longum]|uniref:Uncharacterized protein n=1 Tax=Methylobacterium longum TaxID=767694 RepID=A0ABT8APM3_9HYPH|nr:hypothetical protein [Methylobacterium longum]MDN3571791.1 hypothetical protein [Methylobacterium longum]GJE13992.1 hypothetical protein FOHLNKBM_5061 [Methylobacterium longum]